MACSSARQPLGLPRPIGQEPQCRKRQKTGGEPFDDEQPLPAAEAGEPVHLEDQAGERATEDEGERDPRIEIGIHAGAKSRREPQRQIENHAGEEPGFRNTEKKTDEIEARLTLNERIRDGDGAPGEQDPEHRPPGAKPFQDQHRRHLEHHVADKEESAAEPVDRGRQSQLGIHGQRREADIHAVEIVDHVEQDHERDQPPRALGEDLFLVGHALRSLVLAACVVLRSRNASTISASGRERFT